MRVGFSFKITQVNCIKLNVKKCIFIIIMVSYITTASLHKHHLRLSKRDNNGLASGTNRQAARLSCQ